MQFEAGDGGNFMWGSGIYAEVFVPDGASEDYGYLTMKNAIMKRFPREEFDFPYDGQESFLEEDADVECKVYIYDVREDDECTYMGCDSEDSVSDVSL